MTDQHKRKTLNKLLKRTVNASEQYYYIFRSCMGWKINKILIQSQRKAWTRKISVSALLADSSPENNS